MASKNIFLSLTFLLTAFAHGAENSGNLVKFNSEEGIKRFSRSYNADFFALVNHYESQLNGLFCGPTSAAIVLNALRLERFRAKDADVVKLVPAERSAFTDEEQKKIPVENSKLAYNPELKRYSQSNVFIDGAKSRAEVFGKVQGQETYSSKSIGFELAQLEKLFAVHKTKTKLHRASDEAKDEDLKAILTKNMLDANNFIVVNYFRPAVGQEGGGHISPVAAYDKESDSFLVLDVNPVRAPWVWIKAETLIKGMRAKDKDVSRGFIEVSEGL